MPTDVRKRYALPSKPLLSFWATPRTGVALTLFSPYRKAKGLPHIRRQSRLILYPRPYFGAFSSPVSKSGRTRAISSAVVSAVGWVELSSDSI